MGNWNRRYIPSRKRYRDYDYEDPNPPFDDYSDVSDTRNHYVPQWEINYCKSVRVPWRKVLASKNYSYCCPAVQEWDDSSGEEALNNAKHRYWCSINGLQCEIPLPDPNMYTDEIDWNAINDPELMADLDRAFHDPHDEQQNVRKLATIEEEIGIDRPSNDNPWEVNRARDDGVLVGGWCWMGDSQNMKNSNLCEQTCDRAVGARNNCAWESGNNAWDRRVDSRNNKTSSPWEQNHDRPVDSWNNRAWGSGNTFWDQRVDSQKQTNWEQNRDQVAGSWNANFQETGNKSWDVNGETRKPCTYTNANPRFGNSCAYPRDNAPVRRGWRQRGNRNAQVQDFGFNNYRNNKRSADVIDRGWRDRDDISRVQRGSGWNRDGSFQVDNYGDRRRF